MRIVFAGGGTGGHLYPALAIARALVRLAPKVRPLFIGAERGLEREILPSTEFAYHLLPVHPFYRSRPWENWRTARGYGRAWRLLRPIFTTERPALVLGTGGYASAAPLAYAVRHGVPIALQEQNSAPGMATRLFARYARAIFLGAPEATYALRVRDRAVLIQSGNPIEPPPTPRPDRAAARRAWGFPERGGTVLLVFGGSQGARAINETMDAWLTRGIARDLYVIWGTGRDAFQRYAAHRSRQVEVRAYLAPIADAYAASDLAITRAGALTLAELGAWGLPSVLVPLPSAAADHQTQNALALEAAGASLFLPQASLSVDRLASAVDSLSHDREALERLSANALRRAHAGAAEQIARRILTLVDLT